MNSYHLYLVLLTVFQLVTCYICFLGWGAAWTKFQAWRQDRHRFATSVQNHRMCEGPHDWIEIRWRDGADVTEIRACRACGFIPSKDAMVSKESLPGMDLWYRQRKAIKEGSAAFVAQEEVEMHELMDAIIKNPCEATIGVFYKRAITTQERLQEVMDKSKADFNAKEGIK